MPRVVVIPRQFSEHFGDAVEGVWPLDNVIGRIIPGGVKADSRNGAWDNYSLQPMSAGHLQNVPQPSYVDIEGKAPFLFR